MVLHSQLNYSTGDIGGYMGLLIGASALTILEIVDLIVYNFVLKCLDHIHKKTAVFFWPKNLRGMELMLKTWRLNMYDMATTLQWRLRERDSAREPHDCLFNGLFRWRSKKTSKWYAQPTICVAAWSLTGVSCEAAMIATTIGETFDWHRILSTNPCVM